MPEHGSLNCALIRDLAEEQPYGNNSFSHLKSLRVYQTTISYLDIDLTHHKGVPELKTLVCIIVNTADKIAFKVCTSHFDNLDIIIELPKQEIIIKNCSGKLQDKPEYDQNYGDPVNTFLLSFRSSSDIIIKERIIS